MDEIIYKCITCGEPLPDYVPLMCCSGRDCGCMGLPSEPPVCSSECLDIEFNKHNQDIKNEVKVILDKIFDENTKMKDKNTFLLLSLDEMIKEKKYSTIHRLITSEKLCDFHPSLLMSLLIITESIKDVSNFDHHRKCIKDKMNQILKENK